MSMGSMLVLEAELIFKLDVLNFIMVNAVIYACL